MQDFSHISVMKSEAIQGLNIKANGIYCDVTLGLGGHTEGIVSQLSSDGKVIAFDADIEAIKRAKKRLDVYKDRVTFVHSNFRYLSKEIDKLGIHSVDGVLADLGVSSMELDHDSRGFSFQTEAPLDMRFDQSGDGITAYDVVNEYSQERLVEVFREFGDEPFSGRIARVICENRKKSPIRTTTELSQTVIMAVPRRFGSKSIHPATRVFQAIRMEVNQELDSLYQMLNDAIQVLGSGGRLVVISFHSGEDRKVKQLFRKWEQEGCGRCIIKKPWTPSDDEVQQNPRSRSAKMRIIEKI